MIGTVYGKVHYIDGKMYTEKQLPISIESIKVFNEDFIKENRDWNEIICF